MSRDSSSQVAALKQFERELKQLARSMYYWEHGRTSPLILDGLFMLVLAGLALWDSRRLRAPLVTPLIVIASALFIAACWVFFKAGVVGQRIVDPVQEMNQLIPRVNDFFANNFTATSRFSLIPVAPPGRTREEVANTCYEKMNELLTILAPSIRSLQPSSQSIIRNWSRVHRILAPGNPNLREEFLLSGAEHRQQSNR